MSERFLYSINPKKLIRFLGGVPLVPPVRSSRTLSLTKEEALECMRYGSVYRRFANEGRNERVTTLNIDRLHNSRYMDEKAYEKYLEQCKKDAINEPLENDPEHSEPAVTEEEIKEEPKAEVVDEIVEPEQEVEPVVVEESIEEEVVEETEVETEEEEVEAEESATTVDMRGTVINTIEEPVEDNSQKRNNNHQVVVENNNKYHNNKQYNGGKNKHRH